jgi:hypothetical protein
MSRLLRRLSLVLAGTVGLATITATDAFAGFNLANHTEPV